MEIKKILCPVDFSEYSDEVVEYAGFLAKLLKARVVLIHVLDGLQGLDQFQILSLTPEEIARKMESEARDELEVMMEDIAKGVKAETVLRWGKPFVEIIREIKEKKIDLVVMGSHGRTGIPHLLIGSTAERVVRKSPCPVLVVRRGSREFLMP